MRKLCPQKRRDPNRFLTALGDFPDNRTGAPVNALITQWKRETVQGRSVLADGAHRAPWFTEWLWVMKGQC